MKNEARQKFSAAQLKSFLKLILGAEPPKTMIVFAVIISLIDTVAGLVVPWFTKDLVDVLSVSMIQPGMIALLVGAFVLQAVSNGISYYLLGYVGQTIVANLRKRLWNKVLALPIPYFDKNRSGDTISRMTNDTFIIKDLMSNQLISFMSGIVSILGAVVILLVLDWKMTLVMLTAVPVSMLVMGPLGRKMYKISKQLQNETANFTSLSTQVLSEIRLVKSYNAEPFESRNGETGIQNLFRFGLKEAKVHAVLAPMMTLVMMAVLVVIIGYGGIRVATGALSAGELVAFILYLFQILIPFSTMATFYANLQKAMGATERLVQILEHTEEGAAVTDELQAESGHVIDARQPIRLEHVTFSYTGKDDILHDVTFTIPPGKVTAIVGPSGSGKTTLFSLVERFYLPASGRILLGDIPIQQYSLASWRRQIGYVSQESPLMAGTIRENIGYGIDRAISDTELRRAAEMAYALEFIEEFPNGFDTEVGERGIKLSGGQRQRIAIARALLRNPQILMLDEATSNLDSASEHAVQLALVNLMQGRTTLVIAHRLSTVVNADQIVVLEKGAVTGIGTHAQLAESHELYRELARQQFEIAGEKA